MKRAHPRVLISFLMALAAGICLAQQPIRVRTHLVNVSFSARDVRGVLVEDLTKDDIDVFEDTVPQTVSFFTKSVDVPLTLGLIVDYSDSQDKEVKQHEHDLEVFLKEILGPKDRAFLVCFGDHLRLVSDFSQSGNELIDRLKNYNPSKHGKNAENIPELGPPEDRSEGTAFYDSIYYSVEEKLAGETEGRRALIIFSDGEDNSSAHNMMTTIEAAQTADVLLFTIRYTEEHRGKLTSRNKYGISVMDRIALETGGASYDAKILDPHEYFKKIGEELRTSYQIGYYSTNATKDDSFRKIVIKPKQPGIKIRSKTGYYSR
jgi:Ca-activated chloride channel family protein